MAGAVKCVDIARRRTVLRRRLSLVWQLIETLPGDVLQLVAKHLPADLPWRPLPLGEESTAVAGAGAAEVEQTVEGFARTACLTERAESEAQTRQQRVQAVARRGTRPGKPLFRP
jgi:hypothetical protein